ncbi:MAG: MBL fold metallo-hydrolase [Deltaproteobacteria bacterium]|nr:MBL fold metallo-hydrolase [Deltaproteobacteria bacterium]
MHSPAAPLAPLAPLYQDDALTLWALLGNSQRLDGGAMFGNAPKALWARWIEPDEHNRIPLACRCLLIEERAAGGGRGRLILCEAGIGAFFEPKLRERFGVEGEGHALLSALAAAGFAPEDVDVVALSHLHFDHAGGALTAWREGEAPRLAFPRATFVVGEEALARARRPHARDRASFIPELTALLEALGAEGRLEVVPASPGLAEGGAPALSRALGARYALHVSHGHTPGQLLLEVSTARGPLVFCGDLIPGEPWVHLPITMGYDRSPELLIDEKRALLESLVARGGWLFFTHDARVAAAAARVDERGRFEAVALPAP